MNETEQKVPPAPAVGSLIDRGLGQRAAGGLMGFAYVMRDPGTGGEKLTMATYGSSRSQAKRAMLSFQHRRMEARKPKLGVLNVCAVQVQITDGQPPVDNRFVAPGCELFEA